MPMPQKILNDADIDGWLINLWFGSRCVVLDTSHYGDIQQLAAKRELLGAMAIREQAVVTDAMEAIR